MVRGREQRLEALELGARAEAAVALYLERLGFTIVCRNLRLGRLELDVIALDGRTVVIVEVRTRSESALTTGFGSIDQAKRQRIRRAGERLWRERYRDDRRVDHLRFDAASVSFVTGLPVVSYCRAAF
jgi:putative endonuclease